VNELEGCLRQLAARGVKEAMIVVQATKRNQETKIALTKTTAASVMLFYICLSRLLVGSTMEYYTIDLAMQIHNGT
jgi:hypothetical protein